jgi:hypothetical protein
LKNEIDISGMFNADFIDKIKLKGKEKEISLYNVEEIS